MHINQYPMIGLSKSGQNCSSALSRRPDAGWAGGDICLNGAYTPAQQPKAHPVQRPGDAESAADASRENLRGTRKALRQTAAAVGAAAALIHELTRWPVGPLSRCLLLPAGCRSLGAQTNPTERRQEKQRCLRYRLQRVTDSSSELIPRQREQL